MPKHTTTKRGGAIVPYTTSEETPPQTKGLTLESPQFKTADDIALTDAVMALGMWIHHAIAICYEHGAVVRYGYGTPRLGNPRRYWLEINGNLRGRFEDGQTIARFKAHTETEAVEKATKALRKYLAIDAQRGESEAG